MKKVFKIIGALVMLFVTTAMGWLSWFFADNSKSFGVKTVYWLVFGVVMCVCIYFIFKIIKSMI